MALLAATTLGAGVYDCISAEISSEGPLGADDQEQLRLVVQSYSASSVDADGVPVRGARPLGSMQRAVSSDELQDGLVVQVVQLDEASQARDAIVVAWVEKGEPNLEFDARTARPSAEAVVGSSISSSRSAARVVLRAQPQSAAA
jgi:hypothetical protein